MNIENVHQCRYLGIYVDDMLTWSHNNDIIYSKLLKYIGIFYKIRNKLPMVTLKIFTLHLYIRIFCTAWNLWKYYSNVHLKKLITLNNKLLRILQNRPNKFPVKDLYLNFDTLAIPELHSC